MATLQDIAVSAAINSLSTIAFLVAFAIMRLQPINDRVYFPKWYLKGIRGSPVSYGSLKQICQLGFQNIHKVFELDACRIEDART
jgi:hypothetical protein